MRKQVWLLFFFLQKANNKFHNTLNVIEYKIPKDTELLEILLEAKQSYRFVFFFKHIFVELMHPTLRCSRDILCCFQNHKVYA